MAARIAVTAARLSQSGCISRAARTATLSLVNQIYIKLKINMLHIIIMLHCYYKVKYHKLQPNYFQELKLDNNHLCFMI